MKTVVVLAGGPDPAAGFDLPPDALVIAADGGAELRPAGLVVGDLDSISADTLARALRVERHPADKDATDLELALAAAMREAPERIVVIGSASGRLDHLFGSLLLLASNVYAAVQVDAFLGPARVHVVRGERGLAGEPGELISLFAAHGRATGVHTEGLLYPLAGESLEPGSSRGTSNVFATKEACVAVESGVVIAVRPGSYAADTPS